MKLDRVSVGSIAVVAFAGTFVLLATRDRPVICQAHGGDDALPRGFKRGAKAGEIVCEKDGVKDTVGKRTPPTSSGGRPLPNAWWTDWPSRET